MGQSNRVYFKENVTVLSWNADNSMYSNVGSGDIKVSYQKVENAALADGFTDFKMTKATLTGTFELAVDAVGIDWMKQAGGVGALVFTSPLHTISGTFGCTEAGETMADGLRFSITLESKGAFTIA